MSVDLRYEAHLRASAIGVAYTHAPHAEDVEWQLRGLCRSGDYDPDLWTPTGRNREEKSREAIEICKSCPVIKACAQWALSRREVYGVWGGLSENDRERIWTGRVKRRYHSSRSDLLGA
jgi:WhiB family redox-sensing transcriptional regulator